VLRLASVSLCKSLLGGKVLFVCVKRTVVAVSKETDSLTERRKRIVEDKTNGEEGVASRMQLPGHQM
jgi:hypothetical protein